MLMVPVVGRRDHLKEVMRVSLVAAVEGKAAIIPILVLYKLAAIISIL